MAIDVGSACSDRATYMPQEYTLIEKANPSNADGTIDSICVYANSNMSGIEYAAFTDEGSNIFSTNGDTNGSNLSATAAQQTNHTAAGDDFTAFAITTGDYIGLCWTHGQLKSAEDMSGSWYNDETDDIPCSSVTFNVSGANKGMSIYATGTEAGGAGSATVEGVANATVEGVTTPIVEGVSG